MRSRYQTVGSPAYGGKDHSGFANVAGKRRVLRGTTWKAAEMAGNAVFRMVVSKDSIKNATAISHGNRALTGGRQLRWRRRSDLGVR